MAETPRWKQLLHSYQFVSPPQCLNSSFACCSLFLRQIFDRSSFGNRRTNEGRTKDERWSIEEPSKVERKTNEKLSKTDRETIEKTMTRYFALFGIRSGFVRDALAVRKARKNYVDRKKQSRVQSSRPLKANRMDLLCKILLKYLVFVKNSRFDKILSLYILGIFRKSSYLCTPKTACYTGCC